MIKILSKAGTYHNNECDENQDAVMSADSEKVSVITLADGVSTCKLAREGALTACKAVTDLLFRKGDYFLEYDKKMREKLMISHVVYELKKKAQSSGKDVAEYASTLSSVMYDKKNEKLLFFNLGDSLILTVQNGEPIILAAPADTRSGCPVTTTLDASEVSESGVIDVGSLDSLIICSDGAWWHMFENGMFKQNVKDMLLNADFDALAKYLEAQNGSDDYSFVSLEINRTGRRSAA